jgi:peptide/nickel transport system permease protein
MWLWQRLGSTVLVILFAVTLVFFALRVLPGDAIEAQMVRSGAADADIAFVRAQLGLDDPFWQQYGRYLTGLARGDFGYSLTSQQSVAELLASQLRPTLVLASGALVTAVTLGLGLGILGAFEHPAGAAARLLTTFSLSSPIYWTGTLAIIAVSVRLGWTGVGVNAVLLPVAVLGFHTSGAIARVTQVNIRDVSGAAFVQAARAKGLREGYILRLHILRLAVLPAVGVIGLQAGFLLSGTVITEVLFVRPGLGRLLLRSVLEQDYPVVQGIVVLSALAYTLANTAADIAMRLIDPRLRL